MVAVAGSVAAEKEVVVAGVGAAAATAVVVGGEEVAAAVVEEVVVEVDVVVATVVARVAVFAGVCRIVGMWCTRVVVSAEFGDSVAVEGSVADVGLFVGKQFR